MDLMPTFLEIAGIDYPVSKRDRKFTPLEGLSLLPIFEGRTRKGHETLYWKFGQCRELLLGIACVAFLINGAKGLNAGHVGHQSSPTIIGVAS